MKNPPTVGVGGVLLHSQGLMQSGRGGDLHSSGTRMVSVQASSHAYMEVESDLSCKPNSEHL